MNKRLIDILNICNEKKEISIKELSKLLSVSEVTIRKDVDELIKENLVTNKRGVICLNVSQNGAIPYSLRSYINLDTKIKLSKYAASLIKDDQIVFLDSGSTLSHVVDFVKSNNNVFVTPGLETAINASSKGLRVYLLAGFVHPQSNYVLGNDSIKLLENMNFDIALIGASGISRFYKFATNSPDSAAIKEKAIQQSKKSYIVCDSSKYSVLGFFTFADFDEVTLISDAAPTIDLPNLELIIPNEDIEDL